MAVTFVTMSLFRTVNEINLNSTETEFEPSWWVHFWRNWNCSFEIHIKYMTQIKDMILRNSITNIFSCRRPVTNIADYYFSIFFVVRGSFSFVIGWHKWQSPMRMQQLRVSREVHLKIEIIFDKNENFEFIIGFFCRRKSTFWSRIVQFWIFRVRTGILGPLVQPELAIQIRCGDPWIRINRYKSAQQWNRIQQ